MPAGHPADDAIRKGESAGNRLRPVAPDASPDSAIRAGEPPPAAKPGIPKEPPSLVFRVFFFALAGPIVLFVVGWCLWWLFGLLLAVFFLTIRWAAGVH